MNLLSVVTPPSIYNGCSTQKMFQEGNFTLVNMKNHGRRNVRKHREIKNGEKYITLDISLNFCSLEKMKITSSEPKDYLGRSIKGLIASLGIKIIRRSKKIKKQGFPLLISVLKIFLRLLGNLRICLMRVLWVMGPVTCLMTVTSI